MASPNAAFVEAAVMTLGASSDDIADNVTKTNALPDALEKAGNVDSKGYGPYVSCDIEFDENSTVGSYAGYDTLDISPSEVFTKATYQWKQASVSVTYSGAEQAINSGPEAVHKLITSRTNNAKNTAANYLGRQVYGNGTGNMGKDLGGLALLVPSIPTNIVGGISAAQWAFWRNTVYSFAAAGVTLTGPALLHAMNLTFRTLRRGKDKPDIICTDGIFFDMYKESLQANQRFTQDDPKKAGYGFDNLIYNGNTPIVYDDVAPASTMYMLNTNYMGLTMMKDRNWKPLGDRASVNQDAVVLPMVWMGTMWCSNRKLQGVITA